MAHIELSGRPIAITGASSGIGLATARACAAAGMPVALAARRVDRLNAVAEELRGKGCRALAFECDVTDRGACEEFIKATIATFGGVYAVFANAGYGFEAAYHETPREKLEAIFDANFFGSLNVIDPALEHMRAKGEGHVVFCASCLSKIGIPFYGAYCATKAAQDCVARAMRHELSSLGIAVSSVHPIGTRTEFFDQAQARSADPRIASRTPKSMLQPPERVARGIVRRLSKGKGGEVWTSLPTRAALAVATLMPATTDWALAKMIARRRSEK